MRRHGKVGESFEWEIDTSNRNRLMFAAYGAGNLVDTEEDATEVYTSPSGAAYFRNDDTRADLSLTWGSGYSDPVWALYLKCWVPTWIGRRLKR